MLTDNRKLVFSSWKPDHNKHHLNIKFIENTVANHFMPFSFFSRQDYFNQARELKVSTLYYKWA